jgi:hypothetical protein
MGRCGALEKAAGLYLKLKDLRAAGALMPRITVPKLLVSFGQVCVCACVRACVRA